MSRLFYISRGCVGTTVPPGLGDTWNEISESRLLHPLRVCAENLDTGLVTASSSSSSRVRGLYVRTKALEQSHLHRRYSLVFMNACFWARPTGVRNPHLPLAHS